MDEHEVFVFDSEATGEIEITMKILTRVDLDLAYSSEKITNLDKLLIHIWACESDLEAMSLQNENENDSLFEKSFVFDFLSRFLDSEVRDLDSFMGSLEEVIVNAREEISAFRDVTDLFEVMEAKLHDSEDLLKHSREHILDIGIQLMNLTKAAFAFKQNDWSHENDINLSENTLKKADDKPKMHLVEQKRHILRMLEKSLEREIDLEKKLSEFKQNEEDLRLKQRLTEQVAFAMEEAAEAVWERFLEAENANEVLLSTSKEIINRLRFLEFNFHNSLQRENEANRKLISSNEMLKGREIALEKLENSISELISDNMEVCSLREKVKLLEEQVEETVSQLRNANALNEENEENILEMENIIESLKETIEISENRADNAEAKASELTETNSELNEELNFLKNTNDNNTKKVSSLEKQLRDLEIQLQHARASSEASQEQQNMLYTAIWDMETLVEELKAKVSKAENSEEVNKEAAFFRKKVEDLEMCLEQSNDSKMEIAKDVNVKTKIIMDMVLELALERERIQKQMFGLIEANKVLVEKLQKFETFSSPMNVVSEEASRSLEQVEGSSKGDNFSDSETTNIADGPNGQNELYIYLPIFILFVSVISFYFFNKNTIV